MLSKYLIHLLLRKVRTLQSIDTSFTSEYRLDLELIHLLIYTNVINSDERQSHYHVGL